MEFGCRPGSSSSSSMSSSSDSDRPSMVPLVKFYQVNIHDRGTAAVVARMCPLGACVFTLLLIFVGTVRYPTLLLLVCAVLNTSMWFWFNSQSLFSIVGSRTFARQQAWEQAGGDGSPGGAASEALVAAEGGAAGGPAGGGVMHLVVLPNYKEDEELLAQTLGCLAEAEGSASFRVVLAMEAREGPGGELKGKRLQQHFGKHFAWVLLSVHPSDLVEMHCDGSSNPEVPGKASNLKWAVARGYEKCVSEGISDLDSILLTVADADCLIHPAYFCRVRDDFDALRGMGWERGEGEGAGRHMRTMWQAPQAPFRNYAAAAACSRCWAYVYGPHECGGVAWLDFCGHHMLFSTYTMPLMLAVGAQAWDGDVIAEDHHAYMKCIFYSIYAAAADALRRPGGGAGWDPARAPVLIRPVHLPVKSTSVAAQGYVQAWVEQWNQTKRHAQGVSEFSYLLLASYTAMRELPWRLQSFSLSVRILRIIVDLFCMHLLPVLQGIGLAVLTAYWYVHDGRMPTCPELTWPVQPSGDLLLCGLAGAYILVWPMVVPAVLLITANFLIISTAFLEPRGGPHGVGKIWSTEDGELAPLCGSTKLRAAATITLDVLLLVGPVTGVFGICAQFRAYWNVCFHGNRFRYTSAAKATSAQKSRVASYSLPGAE